jgi:DNA-binding LytR/AlgR family response regulator
MRIAICDDEKTQRETLRKYLEPYHAEYRLEVTEFESGESLVQAYRDRSAFDIIILDIRMKDMDGVETVEQLRRYDKRAIVIFVSSFVQYITSVLRHNVFQFLVKPVKQDLFEYEFNRALSFFQNMHSKYIIKIRDRIINLEIRDIVYIETHDRHLKLHAKKDTYIYNGTLKNEYQKLLPYDFALVHQAYVVNMAEIKTIEINEIILKCGVVIPLSKHLRKSVLSKFNLYMGRRCL